MANENYFCQLDSVVGDGDFGFSLARGFEKVLEGFDGFDRSSPGAFLKKIGLTIASRVGGTSGPIWGTAFLRAGTRGRRRRRRFPGPTWWRMLRAAVEGIQARGGASLGDKTLLDALVPAIDGWKPAWRPVERAGPGQRRPGGRVRGGGHLRDDRQTRPGCLYGGTQHWLSGSGRGCDRSDCEPCERRVARV